MRRRVRRRIGRRVGRRVRRVSPWPLVCWSACWSGCSSGRRRGGRRVRGRRGSPSVCWSGVSRRRVRRCRRCVVAVAVNVGVGVNVGRQRGRQRRSRRLGRGWRRSRDQRVEEQNRSAGERSDVRIGDRVEIRIGELPSNVGVAKVRVVACAVLKDEAAVFVQNDLEVEETPGGSPVGSREPGDDELAIRRGAQRCRRVEHAARRRGTGRGPWASARTVWARVLVRAVDLHGVLEMGIRIRQRVSARGADVLRPGATVVVAELEAAVGHDLQLRVAVAAKREREPDVDRRGDAVVAEGVSEGLAERRIAPRHGGMSGRIDPAERGGRVNVRHRCGRRGRQPQHERRRQRSVDSPVYAGTVLRAAIAFVSGSFMADRTRTGRTGGH